MPHLSRPHCPSEPSAFAYEAGVDVRAWCVMLLCLGLYVARFGYGYGSSDQDEVVPFLLSRLDPSLFAGDWFVQSQQAAFSVRTYFVHLLHAVALVVPVPLAVVLVYLVSWLGIAAGVYRLAGVLTGDRLAALATVPLVLVFTPFWTMGGNDLVHSMLVPSMSAWAFALWGVGDVATGRARRAGLLFGVATWMQALVGLQMACIAGCLLLWEAAAVREGRGMAVARIGRFAASFALTSLPALGPLVYQQFQAAPSGEADLFYIMAQFRNPHHYLPHSFSGRSVARFALLVASATAALYAIRRRAVPVDAVFVTRALVATGAVCVIGYLGTEVAPVLTIAKLQLFKTTVLAKTLCCIAVAAALAGTLRDRVRARLMRVLRPAALLAILASGGAALVLADAAGVRDFGSRIYPFSAATEPAADAMRWVASSTPPDAVVAVPPSLSSFRSRTQRAIVVNHKAFPYRDADIAVWFERLQTMAPIPLPARTDATLLTRLDAAFEALDAVSLRARARTYGATYALKRQPLDAGFDAVYAADGWFVYRIEDAP